MTLTNVRSLFLLVVAVSVGSNVLCSPLLNSLRILDKPDQAINNSRSNHQNISSLGLFSVPAEENYSDDLDTDRITGGKYARKNQFPFMAVVHRLIGEGYVSQCGGTIISRRWVLTAGHCVAEEPRKFFVLFGVNDKSGMGYNYYQGPGISMMTEIGALHPAYKPTINDVGLLYMPRDIPFGQSIKPISLPGCNSMNNDFAGKFGIVIGWGKDRSTGVGTSSLKYATLPIISNSECVKSWAVTSTKHVCTAAGYGEDACQGDSGGPLIVYQNNVPVQIGIVSYGDANCPSNRPGVFSRVTGYIDWIQQVTEEYY
ncbi:chymotrypsin-2-like [Megalopta genalis]|uniref:chymotrypsin-2-like n=1 Tax=Megalopta genalis TaxID=115081 RepID=UPI0014437C6B|nr:venom protease-like [Megalopta genalis]